jgi:hypothetical protein
MEDTPAISRADMADAVRSTSLLADLTISVWSGERTDKKLSEQLKQDNNAVGNTGRYIKNLLAGCDTQLKEVRAAYTAARLVHYKLTLPWVSNPNAERLTGPRLLPNALFEGYLTEMSRLKRQAEDQLARFLEIYPSLVVQAQANLGGMANAADYPGEDEVKSAFKLSFDFEPIPASTAFSGLPEAFIEKLAAGLRRKQLAAAQQAEGAMWDRVKDAIGHLADRLTQPDAMFKASTVEGVRELITLLPGFNCTGDPRVTTVVADIQSMLTGVDAKSLRRNSDEREDVRRQAQAITDKLSEWGL